MRSYSPLRYPGGKGQMYNFILILLEENELLNCTYIEPFCGGAGIAMRLLLENKVRRVVLNDYDKSIYSFWKSILEYTSEFIKKIEAEEICIENWHKQKEMQKGKERYDLNKKEHILELGFSTFYLNRTNRSGIIKAGVIGGLKQEGNYKMDCRFKKEKLINLIQEIAKNKNKIEIHNLDARQFINQMAKKKYRGSFYFIDPPYFNQGKKLYGKFLNDNEHLEIYKVIRKRLKNKKWIVTYDMCQEIEHIYQNEKKYLNKLNYYLEKKRKENELLYYNNLKIKGG